MIKRLLAATALAALPLSGLAHADNHAEQMMIGPEMGAEAPALEVVTSTGAETSLADLAGENGTVLVFVRSADWCPFCKTQMKELNAAVAPLEAKGWSLAALSYDAPDTLAGFADANEIAYTLLSDEGSETIRAFGLFNEEMDAGTPFYGIPHPAIVFIGADGRVRAVLREEGYRDRPPVDVVLAKADALNSDGL